MTGMDEAEMVTADRVRRERLRRRWTVRAAVAEAGGISNTHWGNFEDYRMPLTDGIVTAVVRAYGWSPDWPNARQDTEPAAAAVGELPSADLIRDIHRQLVDAGTGRRAGGGRGRAGSRDTVVARLGRLEQDLSELLATIAVLTEMRAVREGRSPGPSASDGGA